MKAQDVMTSNPACCSPSSTVQEAASLMVDNDCGEIPVIDEDWTTRTVPKGWHLC